MQKISNAEISILLTEIADRLFHQKANPYRIAAYRNAAKKIRRLRKSLADIADYDHIEELIAIPTIGKSIANVIIEYVTTGSSQFMNRIKGYNHQETVFDEIPGIGPHLAHLIQNTLKIRSLEGLNRAQQSGRIDKVKGIGPKRLQMIKMAMNSMFDNKKEAKIVSFNGEENTNSDLPDITILLRLDYLYRNKAEQGELHLLQPHKHNPNNKRWLPIYHKDLKGWHFTCLYSNTLRAHEEKKTKDWVVIYFEKDGKEYQNVVVTETKGELSGMRIIRGKETECYKYYLNRLSYDFKIS